MLPSKGLANKMDGKDRAPVALLVRPILVSPSSSHVGSAIDPRGLGSVTVSD